MVRPLTENKGIKIPIVIVLQREVSFNVCCDPERRYWGPGSGKTEARPKATGLITEIYALLLYLNEKSIKSQRCESVSSGFGR